MCFHKHVKGRVRFLSVPSVCFLHPLFHSSSVESDSVTPWTVDCPAPLYMGFPRQEYRRELPFPSPGDLPDPGIEPTSPALAGGFLTPG